MTAALYLFDIGAGLPSHTVDGVVLIETLQGRLKVNTDEGVHALPAGCALRLSPGVRHDVQAEEPSRMLLIVALEKPDSHA